MYTHSRMLSGGKAIGHGTFSCIFKPALRCKNPREQLRGADVITKLLPIEDAKDEWSGATKIQSIPGWRNYFAVAESICKPIITSTDMQQCHLRKKYKRDTLYALQMRYRGSQIRSSNPLQSHRFSSHVDCMDMIVHLLEAGALLVVHNIIHNDLHQGNIVMDTHDIPRMIDFNLSLNKDTVLDHIHSYQSTVSLPQYSPDILILLGIHDHIDFQSVIRTILLKPEIRSILRMLRMSSNHFISDVDTMLARDAFIKEGNFNDWFTTYWTKIDSWAIGLYIIDLLRILQHIPACKEQLRRHTHTIRMIISYLCAFDPARRFDCLQVLSVIRPKNRLVLQYGPSWFAAHPLPVLPVH